MNSLEELEAESLFILREAIAQCDRPVLLFSGGKDSMVLLHLAYLAAWPGPIPFPVLHVDTGQNFSEVLEFRDAMVKKYGAELIIRKVEDTLRAGRALEDPTGSRNAQQAVTLVDAIRELRFDAVFGGARREEEKARAKERIFSFRNEFSQWDPKNQRIEVPFLFNASVRPGEHMRIFPLSNWTELDIWNYARLKNIPLPSLYFAHPRVCVKLHGQWVPANPFLKSIEGLPSEKVIVRFRTVGDMSCTAAIPSVATSIDEIITELAGMNISERSTRIDDAVSDSAMEDRKRKGYF